MCLWEILNVMKVVILLIIGIIIKTLDFCCSRTSVKYLLFKKKWLSNEKIKYTSAILCYSLVILFFIIFQINKITLVHFKDENLFSILSIVLTIWGIYGVYIGFLQFITEYDNNENGKYLGYNKLDFIAESNIWYHITTTRGFILLLLLSVGIPIYFIVRNKVNNYLLDIWQSTIIFLLLLFIFLLKFSLDVVVKTLEIKKKKDSGLKYFIKNKIKDTYLGYLNVLIKNNFKDVYVNTLFNEIRSFLDNSDIENQIEYLSIVFGSISNSLEYRILDVSKLNKNGREGYKDFLKKKYDLIDEIGKECSKIADFAFIQLEKDYNILDNFVKKDVTTWDQYVTGFDLFSSVDSIFQGIPIKTKVYHRDFYNLDNIHIELFDKFVKISKDRYKDYLILELIKKLKSKKYTQKKWVADSRSLNEKISDIYNFNSTFSISEPFFRDIKEIVISTKYKSEVNIYNSKNRIKIDLKSSILQIEFNHNNGNKNYISQCVLQYYFDNFLEVVWKEYFNLYINRTGNFNREPNILRDPEVIEEKWNGKKRRIIRDYDNKILYSNICYNYLLNNYKYINTETENFYNLIKIVKSMTKDYQAAFSLYQLICPNGRSWDSSVEIYGDILESSLPQNEKEREEFYKNLIDKIISFEKDSEITEELLDKIFSLKNEEVIDNNFCLEFKGLDLLRILLIQHKLSKNKFITREIKIDETEKKGILKKFLICLSETPSLFNNSFPYDTFDYCLKNFYKNNFKLLNRNDYSYLPLCSLMKLEKLLDSPIFQEIAINKQEFMIDKIKDNDHEKGYYIISPFLEFFTLKLTENNGKMYQKLVNEYQFRKDYKKFLLYYLKKNKIGTIDDYLSKIQEELTLQKVDDEFELGDFEKVVIKREIENIIFQNYYK